MASKREILKQMRRSIAAMPKCPTCGGFALPSVEPPAPGERKTFICAEHGAFKG